MPDEQHTSGDRSGPRPSASEFTTAMVHLYRAEAGRADAARRRLDTSTNWAVVATAASISFAFGGDEAQRHVVILLNAVLVTFFLLLEARRYRVYDIWQTRARLMETDFFAPLLWPEGAPCHPDWQQLLATDLRAPRYHISFMEALGWRLRRNYIWIYLMLLLTWLVRIAFFPTTVDSLATLFDHAKLAPIPGWLVVVAAIGSFVGLTGAAIFTRRLHTASGEIMPPQETHQRIEADSAAPDPEPEPASRQNVG